MGMKDVWSYVTKDLETIDWDRKGELEYARNIVYNESCKECHVNLFPQGVTDDGIKAHLYYEENEKKLAELSQKQAQEQPKPIKVEETPKQELKQVDDLVVGFTDNGFFKKMTEKNYNAGIKKIKEYTGAIDFFNITAKVKSDQTLYAFTNLGNCVKIDLEIVAESKFREKGLKFSEVTKEVARNEKPIAFFGVDENNMPKGKLLFFTKDGLIKKTDWCEYTLQKPYYQAIKLKDGDSLIKIEEDKEDTTIAFVTEKGLCLNAEKTDIPVQFRVAGGVKGINLNKGDSIKFVTQVNEEGEFVIVTDTGFYKRVIVADIEPMARYRKGIKIAEVGNDGKVVFANYVTNPYDIAVTDNLGVTFYINTEELSIEGRTNKGKTLKNENKRRMPEKAFKI